MTTTTTPTPNGSSDMMKLLVTALVTVAGSYMSITSHIDRSVSDKVDQAMHPLLLRIEAVKYHADSLHQVHMNEVHMNQAQVDTEDRHKRKHR